jgi:hypothetical protein
MTDQAVPHVAGASQTNQKRDARDLQAHLYREIGISAVAAALSISASKDSEPEVAAAYPTAVSPDKNELAA